MAYCDFREFLTTLEKEGQLLRISAPVLPEPDISAAGRAVGNIGTKAPALIFENIEGYETPLALNIHGSWYNHALMLGLPKDTSVKEQIFELDKRWNEPIAPVLVDDAPLKEVKITNDIDLFKILPLYKTNQFDGGCYISKASIISRDPEFPDDFNKQNVGIYRLQVKGKNKLGIQPLPFHDLGIHVTKAERMGIDLPISITIGNEPIISFMASTPLEYNQSEYEYAGGLQQEAYRIIKAENSNHDLPAGSEIVLEGVIKAGIREIEGPFGEFPGSYSGTRKQPVVEIQTITHRKKPIMENLYLGIPWTEIDYLMALNTSLSLYRQLKETFPEVEAVNAMYTHGIGVIISTESRFGGFGKAVAMRLLSTPHGMPYSKIIIIVDKNVDPFNLEQVMWAVTTRVSPDQDVNILKNMPGMTLDPSSNPPGMHSKLIIDATTPVAPDKVLRDTELLHPPKNTEKWEKLLRDMINKGIEPKNIIPDILDKTKAALYKICPRCDKKNISLLSNSPIRDKWKMYLCNDCLYSWRSTEIEELKNPELYSKKFKLTKEIIENLMEVPPLPGS
ncbi:MAG: UbiD family decarboxylase [bacterium]|nr:UbiD family decarboxylase [bacterium]